MFWAKTVCIICPQVAIGGFFHTSIRKTLKESLLSNSALFFALVSNIDYKLTQFGMVYRTVIQGIFLVLKDDFSFREWKA